MADFRNLTVWQEAMNLTVLIYTITENLPKEEIYGLQSQLRRAAVSIPSNIAEGYGRNSDKELLHFLSIASGSIAEIETQTELCLRLKFFSADEVRPISKQISVVRRLLTGFINTVNNTKK